MLENLDEALRNPLYESLIEFDEPEDEMDYAEESKKVDINSLSSLESLEFDNFNFDEELEEL